MARARNIKPSLFKNELLGQDDPLLTLLFISLWTLADKAGRLEDRPLRIKAETFPYRENIDINGYLTKLVSLGFIERYKGVYEGKEIGIIEVVNFVKHQTPHSTEKPSQLPEKPVTTGVSGNVSLNNESASVNGHINVLIPDSSNTDLLIPDSLIPDSLIPDSLIPDSLIPDSLIPESVREENSAPPEKKSETELQLACKQVWKSYCDAYFERYRTEAVRNAKVNSMIKQFVQRIGFSESPHVAAFFVSSNNGYYVGRMHTVDCLLADAEKLRTEWATGQSMTRTKAMQVDKTQQNKNAVNDALAYLEGGR